MKPIRIIDSEFNLLGEVDSYTSLIFTRRWHRIGEFQIVCNMYANNAEHLKEQNLIILGGDTKKCGIILHREIQLDEKGKASENWLIKGLTLEGITKRRLTVPPIGSDQDVISGNAETVMKHYVTNNIISPVDVNRKIEQVINANNQLRGQQISWQSRYKQLDEELERMSYLTGIGWFMYLDYNNKKWVFDVKEGRNLTASQSINPPVIFSPEFDSIQSQKFIDSVLDYKSTAYMGGQGEGTARTILQVGQATGLDRFETFVDARDKQTSQELTQHGLEILSEVDRKRSFGAEILQKSPFVYQKDWDLGDIVTVQNKQWNVTMDSRITEVQETFEPSGFKLSAVFGNDMPTLITKLKRELRQVSTDVTK